MLLARRAGPRPRPRRSSSSAPGSEIAASATSRSTRRRARSISSSGRPTFTASPRDGPCASGPRIVASRSTRRPPLAVAAAALDLGPEDLGATLDEPAQERQVLALGEALVAARAGARPARARRGPRRTRACRIRSMRRFPPCSLTRSPSAGRSEPMVPRRPRPSRLSRPRASIWYGFTAAPPPGWYSKCRWFVEPALPGAPDVADHGAGPDAAARGAVARTGARRRCRCRSAPVT